MKLGENIKAKGKSVSSAKNSKIYVHKKNRYIHPVHISPHTLTHTQPTTQIERIKIGMSRSAIQLN